MTGAQSLIKTLKELGVTRIYGIPGGQTLSIVEAVIADNSTVDFVVAHHEGGAAVMADAEGRLTGEPGVCLATTGPGATNLATGLGGALRDSSPVVAITCNNYSWNLAKDDAQNLNHVEALRSVTKHQELVLSPDIVSEAVSRAYHVAKAGCPGPVLLDFSRDALENELSGAYSTRVRGNLWLQCYPSPAGVGALRKFIDSHRRPLLWIGNGVKLARSGQDALRLAKKAEIPIITTYNGMGSVPTNDDYVHGVLFRHGTKHAATLLAQADGVMAVGNSLNAISTNRWTLELPDLAQVDVDATALGRYYPVDVGVVGGSDIVLRSLSEMTYDHAIKRRAWVQQAIDSKRAWESEIASERSRHAVEWNPVRLIKSVNNILVNSDVPVIWCADAGNPGIWSVVLTLRSQDRYMKPVGFGNMGFSLPAAVAASCTNPDDVVVVLIGDGSLGMSLGELETVSRRAQHTCVIVMDDNGYGNIRQEYLWKYKYPTETAMGFNSVAYGEIGRACGFDEFVVNNGDSEALNAALRAVRDGRPVLIHAKVDGSRSVWPVAL